MKGPLIPAVVVIVLAAGVPAAGTAAETTDPVLAEVLKRAEWASPAMARARAAVRGSQARVDGAHAPYWPTIGVSEQYTSTDNAPAAFALTLDQGRFTSSLIDEINDPPSVADWATQLYARFLIYDFGRRGSGLDAARADAERWELLEAATRRDVRYGVTEAYHDLRRSHAAVGLWEETVRLFQAHEDLTRARHEAGAALRSDLLSIGVQLAEARENLISARDASHIGLVTLATAVGVSWTELDIPPRDLEAPSYGLDEEMVAGAARASHPGLAAIDAGIRGAASVEKSAGRGRWPTISAEARGIWHGEDEAFGVERGSYLAMVMLDIPLIEGGRSGAEKSEAAARREGLEASRREAADALELAARSAHRRAQDAVARIAIADSAVASATEALAIIEERYSSGLAKVVDLIEVQRALTAARVRALDARAQAWNAIAAVERVAGEEVFP